jgi:hypothetical protein
MMRMRAALLVAVAIIATWWVTTSSAQSAIPNGVFVKNSEGLVWLVLVGQRVKIPVWAASDEEIAAVPVADRWAVMNDAGAIVAGDRPAWLADESASAPPAAPAQSAAPTTTPKSTATPRPPSPAGESPINLSGERGENTKPFDLRGGNYTVAWKTELRRDSSSCFSGATLYRVEGKVHVESLYSITLYRANGDRSAEGETQVYGVRPGQHYLDVNTTACSWSVGIRPQ